MASAEMHNMTEADLENELIEQLKAQFSLRMRHATQQLDNTAQIRQTRRQIARIRTILHQKGQK